MNDKTNQQDKPRHPVKESDFSEWIEKSDRSIPQYDTPTEIIRDTHEPPTDKPEDTSDEK